MATSIVIEPPRPNLPNADQVLLRLAIESALQAADCLNRLLTTALNQLQESRSCECESARSHHA